ncbi:MAG: hemolysin III family protein [Parachlamydiales bacterium]|jgi:hemolysin III
MEIEDTMDSSLAMPASINIEEVANTLTHGLGLLLSILGLGWLLSAALISEDICKICSATVFGSTLIILYAASTFYHGMQDPKTKQTLKIVDHCAIYALIAGTYTPFALVTLSETWGWTLFSIVWSLAFVGILFKIFFIDKWPILSTLFYLGMGWMIVIASEAFIEAMPMEGLYLIVAGGLSYSFGAIIYVLEKPVFHHAIWHMFVIGGSMCHYFAILHYVV